MASLNERLSLIVACAENRVIGREGRLPWHIPEDLNWFHARTAACTVLLGRICYETWPRVHLDGRRPVVVTSRTRAELRPCPQEGLREGEPWLARDVPEALGTAGTLPGEILVCGGERIYEATLPLATKLYLTQVHASVPGDVRFPLWQPKEWIETYRRESADSNHRYTFRILRRKV